MRTTRNVINLAMVFSLWLLSGLAQAGQTPGNTALINKATLTYTGNSTGVDAFVTVTVATVGVLPLLVTPLNTSKAENQAYEDSYTITAQNNGVDTYTLTFTATTTGLDGTYVAPTLLATSGGSALGTTMILGASAVLSGTSTTVFRVPSDGATTGAADPVTGTAGNVEVNGLKAGDTIKIGTETRIISSVVDDASVTAAGVAYATITLTTALTSIPTQGTEVFEVQTFYVNTANVGAQTSGGTYQISIDLDVTPGIAPLAGAATLNGTPFIVSVVKVNITKYVRNDTLANCLDSSGNTAGIGTTECAVAANFTTTAAGGASKYFRGGVTNLKVNAGPADTLEYLIRVETAPDAGSELANAEVVDVLPPFTDYVASSTLLNNKTVAGDGSTLPLLSPMLIDDDVVTRVAGAAATGVVGLSQTVDVVYKVTLQ